MLQLGFKGGVRVAEVKVLGINASPRKYGNTFKMLWLAGKGVEDEGGKFTMLHLYDYRLEKCVGCYSDSISECYFPKRCPLNLQDDYKLIANLILESDAVIFATPVYWFNASAALKTLIERMTSLENMVNITGRSLVDGKVAGAIAAGEEAGAALALAWLTLTLNMMGFHIPAWATAYYHGRGDVLEDKQAVLDAYNVGRSVVRAVKRLKGEEKPWYIVDVWDRVKQLIPQVRKIAEENRDKSRRDRPWLHT
jgi:multimeric flavodoxin WrbA